MFSPEGTPALGEWSQVLCHPRIHSARLAGQRSLLHTRVQRDPSAET